MMPKKLKMPEFLKRKPIDGIIFDEAVRRIPISIYNFKPKRRRYSVYLKEGKYKKKLGKVDALNPTEAKERAIKKWRLKEEDIDRLIIYR